MAIVETCVQKYVTVVSLRRIQTGRFLQQGKQFNLAFFTHFRRIIETELVVNYKKVYMCFGCENSFLPALLYPKFESSFSSNKCTVAFCTIFLQNFCFSANPTDCVYHMAEETNDDVDEPYLRPRSFKNQGLRVVNWHISFCLVLVAFYAFNDSAGKPSLS